MLCEDFSEVEAFYVANVPIQPAADLHQAARVVADHKIRFGFEDGIAFHLGHCRGDLRVFYGEGPAETAARFRLCHFHKLEPFDVFEQFAWGLFGSKLPEPMTAVMEGRGPLKACSEVFDSELVDQEFREFPRFFGEHLGCLFLWMPLKEFWIENFEHGAAGTGGRDDNLCIVECVELVGGHGARLVPVAGVEGRLAAAGLVFRHIDGVTEALEDSHHGHPDVWEEGVDEAGDEEGDAHWKEAILTDDMGSGEDQKRRGGRVDGVVWEV